MTTLCAWCDDWMQKCAHGGFAKKPESQKMFPNLCMKCQKDRKDEECACKLLVTCRASDHTYICEYGLEFMNVCKKESHSGVCVSKDDAIDCQADVHLHQLAWRKTNDSSSWINRSPNHFLVTNKKINSLFIMFLVSKKKIYMFINLVNWTFFIFLKLFSFACFLFFLYKESFDQEIPSFYYFISIHCYVSFKRTITYTEFKRSFGNLKKKKDFWRKNRWFLKTMQ